METPHLMLTIVAFLVLGLLADASSDKCAFRFVTEEKQRPATNNELTDPANTKYVMPKKFMLQRICPNKTESVFSGWLAAPHSDDNENEKADVNQRNVRSAFWGRSRRRTSWTIRRRTISTIRRRTGWTIRRRTISTIRRRASWTIRRRTISTIRRRAISTIRRRTSWTIRRRTISTIRRRAISTIRRRTSWTIRRRTISTIRRRAISTIRRRTIWTIRRRALFVVRRRSSSKIPQPVTEDYLNVGKSRQHLFDSEGLENPDGILHSRVPHLPPGASGVTIGRGYDMKSRSKQSVIRDLKNAGVPDSAAKRLAEGVGLTGQAAKKFIKDFASFEITKKQQRKLFDKTYSEQQNEAKRLSSTYFKTNWESLNPKIQEVLTDLKYRGDFLPTSQSAAQQSLKEAVQKNDLSKMKKVLKDGYWKKRGVTQNRIDSRLKILEDK